MENAGWYYYNHAMLPAAAPHENSNVEAVENGELWKHPSKPILARWTTKFDCSEATNWWYVIKDDVFDLMELKAKRRYEINKGNKNFDVRLIDPCVYAEDLYRVQVAAFSAYPEKYRPTVHRDNFVGEIANWNAYKVYAAFSRNDDGLCGYALLNLQGSCVHFSVLKSDPSYEASGINAALVYAVVEGERELLLEGGYICDGARAISHETAFQDYLEKYFGFRKAYCQLHIAYAPKWRPIIKILYPFRSVLRKMDRVKMIHKINGVLRMEELSREAQQ